jgi:hypothetical protein
LRVATLAVVVCSLAAEASAQPSSALSDPCGDDATAAELSRRVDVVLWADDAEASALLDHVQSLLARLEVRLCVAEPQSLALADVLMPPPHVPPRLGRVFVQPAEGRLMVYLVDGPWERVLVRDVQLPDDALDEAVRSEVGLIVYTNVEALLAGSSIGVPRRVLEAELTARPTAEPETEPDAQPAPAPTAQPCANDGRCELDCSSDPDCPLPSSDAADEERGMLVRAGAAYRIRAEAGGPAHEVGLLAGLGPASDSGFNPVFSLRMEYGFSKSYRANDVSIDVALARAAATIALEVPMFDAGRFAVAVGAGAELEWITPNEPAPRVTLAAEESLIVPLACGEIGYAHRVVEGFSIAIGLDLIVSLIDVRHAVADATNALTVVSDPHTLRPAAWLALILEL